MCHSLCHPHQSNGSGARPTCQGFIFYSTLISPKGNSPLIQQRNEINVGARRGIVRVITNVPTLSHHILFFKLIGSVKDENRVGHPGINKMGGYSLAVDLQFLIQPQIERLSHLQFHPATQ